MPGKIEPQNIVLTGAGGFIGQRVLAELIRTTASRIVAVGRRPFLIPAGSADRITMLLAPDGDFTASFPLEPFTIIHCAWCPPVRDTWVPHSEQINLIAQALVAGGERIDRIVGVGSAEEYGDKSGTLAECDEAGGWITPYGWGKRAAQMLLRSWSAKMGRAAFWLRPFTVYGEGQTGDMVIPVAVRSAVQRIPAKFSDGLQRRDFIHVDDVARALVLAAVAPVACEAYTLNLGTGSALAVRSVLEQLAAPFQADGLFRFGALPRRPHEPAEQCAETGAAAALLGWRAAIGVEEGLHRIYRHAGA